ncbi:MAG: NTP transferase domain-containing protein [Clostridia bacterium]|nr:NTP transferase domain-containing protein [Clostridia bacterium]
MKAIIMAGGEGRRLRPITDTIPKPLLPIGGVPTIVRILSLLRSHGIGEAAITVGYLSDKIISTLGASTQGVELTYLSEETPLGTAGGVKNAESFIGDDDFIVISGDALSECDLSAAIDRRKKMDAPVLMILTHCSEPGEYGVVLTDGDGYVSGFCEKPSLSSTYSDLINTGIYVMSKRIFDFIPEGKCDFSNDVFPKLLSSGEKIATFTDQSYWCDIGDFSSYKQANLRYSNGKNSVGKDCRLPPEGVNGSVILNGVKVGRRSKIESSVICSNTIIGDGTNILRDCVIGHGCVIGDNCVISEGTVLPSGSEIPDGSFIRQGAPVSPDKIREMLDEGAFRTDIRTASPSFCVRLGLALATASGGGRIGIMTDGSQNSERVSSALLRGIGQIADEAVILGHGFEAAASYAGAELGLGLSLFVRSDDRQTSVTIYDRDGLYPTRDFERKFVSSFGAEKAKEEKKMRLSHIDFLNEAYLPFVVSNRCPLEGIRVTVKNEDCASRLMKEALEGVGAMICDNGIKLSLSSDGFSLSAEQDGFILDDWHIKALLLRYLIRDKVSLPSSVPSVLLDLCRKNPYIYTLCPSGESESEARKNVSAFPELLHGAIAAAELLALISVSGKSLRELCVHIPSFALSSSILRTNDRRRFSILTSLGTPSGDGVKTEYEKGSVRVIPRNGGYTIIAEAASGEYAEELISLSEKEILALLRNGK